MFDYRSSRRLGRIWIEYENAFYLAEEIGKDDLCNLSLLKLTKRQRILILFLWEILQVICKLVLCSRLRVS